MTIIPPFLALVLGVFGVPIGIVAVIVVSILTSNLVGDIGTQAA